MTEAEWLASDDPAACLPTFGVADAMGIMNGSGGADNTIPTLTKTQPWSEGHVMAEASLYGEPSRRLTPNELLRLLRMVSVEGGCWLWTGHRDEGGYGKFTLGEKCLYAHRVSYEYFVGSIPDGMEIDHLCRNRPCINPEHFEVVTSAENTRRGEGPTAVNSRRTHCVNGHLFDNENTHFRFRAGRVGHTRVCRICEREKCRRRRAIHKAAGEAVNHDGE